MQVYENGVQYKKAGDSGSVGASNSATIQQEPLYNDVAKNQEVCYKPTTRLQIYK